MEALRLLYIDPSNHTKCTSESRDITMLLFAFAEIPPTKRPEEKESCEVWNGWHDYRLADLYCLVPTALHVFNQICCRHHQQASRCINHNNSRRLSGKKDERLKANWFCTVFPWAVSYSIEPISPVLCRRSGKLPQMIPLGFKNALVYYWCKILSSFAS